MIIDSPIISGSHAASGSLNQTGNVVITGSLTVTGTINGSITGSITTASYALNAETLDGLDSTSFTTTSSFNTVSGSFSTRVTNLESFSSSLDATFATDAQLTAVSQSFSSSLSTVSGSLASRVANNEATGSSLTTASGSFSTRVTNTEATASSLVTASGSFSTRTTNLETASGSFSTRTTNLETASGSFSTRVTNNESNISSLQTASGSFSTRTTNLETASGSFSTRTTNLETASGSFSTRVTSAEGSVTSLNSKTGSYATTGSNIFVNTQYISAANNAISFTSTASLYTDGGLRVTKDMYVSGTAYFNNVTVYGTQSVQYITSSQLNISTNIISVNTDTPTIRFGGLSVYDSGSTGLTGSMLWDSEDNQWIYSNPSGSTYDSAVFLAGPRNSGVLGNEPGISCNFLSKGNGLHHMTSSGIFEDGSRTCFYGNTVIGSGGTVCTTMANASCIGIGTTTPTDQLSINNGTSNSYATLRLAGSNRGGQINFYNQQYPTAQILVDQSGNIDFSTGVFAGASVSTKFSIANTGGACFACSVQAGANFISNITTDTASVGTTAATNATYNYTGYSGYWGIRTTTTGNNFALDTYNGGTPKNVLTITQAGVATFLSNVCVCGDLSVVSAGSTTVLFDGTNPTLTLRRNNNGNASAAINFKGSSAVKWQIGTNQAIGLGFEINEGDATTNRFYIAPGGITCFACQVCAPVAIFTGCVGIGTTSPSYKLDVYSSTTATQVIGNFAAANYGSPSSRTYIQIGTQYGDGSSRIGSINTTGNQSALIFQSHAATSGVWNDAMYISGGGEVGIGTTSPATLLHIASSGNTFLTIDGGASSNTGVTFYKGGSAAGAIYYLGASDAMRFDTSNTERMRINQYGQLLINATSSAYSANLFGYNLGVRGTNNQTFISIARANQTLDTQGMIVGLDTTIAYMFVHDNIPLTLSTNATERLRINNSGIACFSCQVCAPYICVGRNAGGDTTNYGLSINRHGDLNCSHAYTTVPAFTIGEFSNAGPTSGLVDVAGIWNLSFGRYSHTMACAKFASLMFIGYDGAMGPLRVDGRGNMFVGYDRTAANGSDATFSLLVACGIAAGSYQYCVPPSGGALFSGTICTGGHIIPTSNGTLDLGSSSNRWCTVYTSDLSLNNGIGNYTIVEGENDLFLYNNNSCKVYKFIVQEVCPEIAPAKRSI